MGSVESMAKVLQKDKDVTFATDSIHITYIASFEPNIEVMKENVEKECNKLAEQTEKKIPCAVFSHYLQTDTMISGFYVPPVIE